MSPNGAGPHCSKCGRNEQQCAATWPCCLDCQHWRHLNEEGNSKQKRLEPTQEQRLEAAIGSFRDRTLPPVAEPAPDVEASLAVPLSPYLTDPLLRELIPQRISAPMDNGDGPTAWLMRRERQRLLWQMAAENDDPDVSGSGVEDQAV